LTGSDALNLATKTIRCDLEGFDTKSKADRPEGGRPKKSLKTEAHERKIEMLLQRVEAGEAPSQLARSTGYKSNSTLYVALDRAKAARYDRLPPDVRSLVSPPSQPVA
jgi:hypothetical protein